MYLNNHVKSLVSDLQLNMRNLGSKMYNTRSADRYYHDSRIVNEWLLSISDLFSDSEEEKVVELLKSVNTVFTDANNLDNSYDAYQKFKQGYDALSPFFLRAYISFIQSKSKKLYVNLKDGVSHFSSGSFRVEMLHTLLPLLTRPELAIKLDTISDDNLPFFMNRDNPYTMMYTIDVINKMCDEILKTDIPDYARNGLVITRRFIQNSVKDFLREATSLVKNNFNEKDFILTDAEGVEYSFKSVLLGDSLESLLKGNWYSQTTYQPIDFTLKANKRIDIYL